MDIPLFPLPNLVLFPQVVVPLHIFEERYKLMINRCIDNSLVFGVVLLREGAEEESEETIHRVGVTARIVEVDRLEDGRMNILNVGEARFRVMRFTGNSPYWTASVDFFEDEQESPEALREAYEEVSGLYRQLISLAAPLRSADTTEPALPESPLELSYAVSYVLDIEFSKKQSLLETTSTSYRLRSLVLHLQEAIQQLETQLKRKQIESKVRGNGDLTKFLR